MASADGNDSSPAVEPDEVLQSVSFSTDGGVVGVATNVGFQLFSCEPFRLLYKRAAGVRVVESLPGTSLVAVVGAGFQPSYSPRRLIVFNSRTDDYICQLNFKETVEKVLLNGRRLVAVLPSALHVFDVRTMKSLHALRTCSNRRGLCALSPNAEKSYMVFPAADEADTDGTDASGGEDSAEAGVPLLLYDTLTLQVKAKVTPHRHGTRVAVFNREGTLLATASNKGTVVRVFSVPRLEKLHTFRRGSTNRVVHSLAFSPDSTLLALTSDSETVHVFDLDSKQRTARGSGRADEKKHQQSSTARGDGAKKETKGAMTGRTPEQLVTAVTNTLSAYVPAALSDLVQPERGWAWLSIKGQAFPWTCAFDSAGALMVATAEGCLYRYLVPEEGGQCRLVAEHSILEQPREAFVAASFND